MDSNFVVALGFVPVFIVIGVAIVYNYFYTDNTKVCTISIDEDVHITHLGKTAVPFTIAPNNRRIKRANKKYVHPKSTFERRKFTPNLSEQEIDDIVNSFTTKLDPINKEKNEEERVAEMKKRIARLGYNDQSRGLSSWSKNQTTEPCGIDVESAKTSFFPIGDIAEVNVYGNFNMPPLVDENEKMPPLVDENEEMPPLVDENEKMPSLVDENEKMPSLVDENEKMPPLVDENEKMPPLVDENDIDREYQAQREVIKLSIPSHKILLDEENKKKSTTFQTMT